MSDKNFKVKNGLDAVGPITISPLSNATNGLIFNTLAGGRAITFNREGSNVGSIDDWGTYNGNGINIVQPWYTRSPGVEAQSFFWVGSGARSAAGFAGTNSGTNPVIYISQNGSAANDLTQWIKSDNTVLAKVDYLGNITANDLILAGNLTVNGTTTNLNSTNLIIEDKNIIIADVVTPTDTTADGAGITIKGATDKTLNWVQSTKSFTSSDPFIINNTSTSTVPLSIFGYASQTSDYFQIKDSSANVLLRVIAPAGDFAYNNRVIIRPGGTGGPAQIGAESFAFRIIAPHLNSISFGTAGGGTSLEVVTSDSFNRYKILGKGTGIAPIFTTDGNDADVNMHIYAKGAGKIGINTTSPTGYIHVVSSSSSVVGLIVESAASQTANLQEWQNSSGTVLAKVTAAGDINIDISQGGSFHAQASGGQVGDYNLIKMSQVSTQKTTLLTTVVSGGNTEFSLKTLIGTLTTTLKIDKDSLVGIGKNNTSPLAQIDVRPQSASTIGAIIRGAASQTADLQVWQNSASATLARITSAGNFGLNVTSPEARLDIAQSVNMTLLSPPGAIKTTSYIDANSGTTSGYLATSASVFFTTTKSGSALNSLDDGYVAVSARNIVNGDGTVNQLVGFISGADLYSGSIGTHIGLKIRGTTNYGTATIGNSIGIAIGAQKAAHVTTGYGIVQYGVDDYNTFNGRTTVQSGNAAYVPLVVKGAASQTANVFEVQNSSGSAQVYVNAYGQLAAVASGMFVNPGYSSGVGITVRGYASQTANLQEWQNSAGTVLASVASGGGILANSFSAVNGVVTGSLSFSNISYNGFSNPTGVTSVPTLVVKGIGSQTANLQEWQNSSGTVLTRIGSDGAIYRGAMSIDSFGAIYTAETVAIGATMNQRFATGGLTIINRENASAIILGIKGVASQTGDLTQWRNSSDTVLAKVDANGNFSAISKSFDIPHPTKENMRLRYASLEGPENGVYIRGTVESNIIELPEYWTGLVHEDSITASLTSVGSAQNIYVEKIENNKIYIGGNLEKAFFTVYGERKDIDKLTVEY